MVTSNSAARSQVARLSHASAGDGLFGYVQIFDLAHTKYYSNTVRLSITENENAPTSGRRSDPTIHHVKVDRRRQPGVPDLSDFATFLAKRTITRS